MASDYDAIREENRLRYGTDIGRIGPMLLADRYDDRTHFIFELLQNAEDSLGRRENWRGSRRVNFELAPGSLTLSHFGRPFDEADVRGVCGIAESTKGVTAIGRFGIGFKSVYTFTQRPEIHSGGENFAIENYVQPTRQAPLALDPEETRIVLPLHAGDAAATREISDGFERLGANALLFLRNIDEINWKVQGGDSGTYLRSEPEVLGANVQRVTVLGQAPGHADVDQNWLVFHREVFSGQARIGRVEVAFSLHNDDMGWSIQPLALSPLVVFFPTVVMTNLGFLVQGPYRTTPSRDNIPRGDAWNLHLVKETASLLIEALRWLRDRSMVNSATLRCLPLDRAKFEEGSRFATFFQEVRAALLTEPLLPRFDGGHVPASQAKLARTQELRELISPDQLAQLYEMPAAAWLTGDITPDRTPDLRQYLMKELDVAEVTPAMFVTKLTATFLESQSDEWIVRFYQFLGGQEGVRRYLEAIPFVRLASGQHVSAKTDGKANAFLPSAIATDFPLVRASVCEKPEVRAFLSEMGISEPDPVDDVLWNVLPKYRQDDFELDTEEYAADIERIRAAFNTDSVAQKAKLIRDLRASEFLMVVDMGDQKSWRALPQDVYLASERLKEMFAGVGGVHLVDDAFECLRGESMRELLEACGALRYPRPVEVPDALDYAQRRELRRQAGHEQTSGQKDRVEDWTLDGFEALVKHLPALGPEERRARAQHIWESLSDLEARRGRGVFDGVYSWSHHGLYRKEFPAAFVRHLQDAAWVPDASGELRRPGLVDFEELGWRPHPFLLSKIAFKPSVLDELARASGIEPAALDLLRKLGITSVAEIASRLAATAPPQTDPSKEAPISLGSNDPTSDVYDDAADLYGDDGPDVQPPLLDPDEEGDEGRSRESPKGGAPNGSGQKSGDPTGSSKPAGGGKSSGRSGGHSGGGKRTFISYVAANAEEEAPDPDGLDQAARMRLEAMAIDRILALEPQLMRTPPGNEGFDLFEPDASGSPLRWIEVKAMTGSLTDRPVSLSRPQFEFASVQRARYWLYVVENAADPSTARILRIQDPAGRSKNFTFDQGWMAVARTIPVPRLDPTS